MGIVSNVEFEVLTEGRAPRLHAVAVSRRKADPVGTIQEKDVHQLIELFAYSGDRSSANWLKNLLVLHKNGTLGRIRTNNTTYEDHVAEVRMLYAANQIPFDIGQHVQCKECGKYGSIVDYVQDTGEYIVILNPFQVRTYKKDQLTKVAEDKTVEQE